MIMRKCHLLSIVFLMVAVLYALPLVSSNRSLSHTFFSSRQSRSKLRSARLAYRKRSDTCQKDVLITTATNVANTFGSAYVPFFKDAEISELRIFQKDDYGDKKRKIRKQIGRAYYEVTFTYDTTAVRFAFNYAAKVRIWEDTGEPLDVIFGNGMGRNFLFKSFKKQTKHYKKKKLMTAHLIEQVPLQTEKATENIWKIKVE